MKMTMAKQIIILLAMLLIAQDKSGEGYVSSDVGEGEVEA